MAIHIIHSFTVQGSRSGRSSIECWEVDAPDRAHPRLGFLVDIGNQPVNGPEVTDDARIVDRLDLLPLSRFVSIGIRTEGPPPAEFGYGWRYLWRDGTPDAHSRTDRSYETEARDAPRPAAEGEPRLGVLLAMPSEWDAERNGLREGQGWRNSLPPIRAEAGAAALLVKLVAPPRAVDPPRQAGLTIRLRPKAGKESWPMEVRLSCLPHDAPTDGGWADDQTRFAPGDGDAREWQLEMGLDRVVGIVLKVNAGSFDPFAFDLTIAPLDPGYRMNAAGPVEVALRPAEAREEAPATEPAAAKEPDTASKDEAAGDTAQAEAVRIAWERFAPKGEPSSHTTVIAIDIGSSTIAAARIEGSAGNEQPEVLRLGTVVDDLIEDAGRVDHGNPALMPSAIWLAGDGTMKSGTRQINIVDPATRDLRLAGKNAPGEAMDAFLKRTGRPVIIDLPARSQLIIEARQEILGPRPLATLVAVNADLGGGVTLLDPKGFVIRNPDALAATAHGVAETIIRADHARQDQDIAEDMLAEMIASILRSYLPNLKSDAASGKVSSPLQTEWYWPTTPRHGRRVVVALSHPASIGKNAMKRYRDAAETAVGLVWPMSGSGRHQRPIEVVLVPEALAVAARLEFTFNPDPAPGEKQVSSVSCARDLFPNDPPAGRIVVLDIGNGTTDVAVLRYNKGQSPSAAVSSFAVPIAGAAMHRWLEQGVRDELGRGADASLSDTVPNLADRIDRALRARLDAETHLAFRIDAIDSLAEEKDAREDVLARPSKTEICAFHRRPVPGGGESVWAVIDIERILDLPVFGAALKTLLRLVLLPTLRRIEGVPFAIVLSGRAALTPGVSLCVSEILDDFSGIGKGRASGASAAMIWDVGALLTGPLASKDDARTTQVMKLAVAFGTANIADLRSRNDRVVSSAAERAGYAVVQGTFDDRLLLSRVADFHSLGDRLFQLGEAEQLRERVMGWRFFVCRTIPGLEAGDLTVLTSPENTTLSIEKKGALLEIEQACVRPINHLRSKLEPGSKVHWKDASTLAVKLPSGEEYDINLSDDGNYM